MPFSVMNKSGSLKVTISLSGSYSHNTVSHKLVVGRTYRLERNVKGVFKDHLYINFVWFEVDDLP